MAQKPVRVAGIDVTWSGCLVAVVDVASGEFVRIGRAGIESADDPEAWWAAVREAIVDAGGFTDVSAFAVTAPTGLVALDAAGAVVHVDRAGVPLAAARALHANHPEEAAAVEAVLQPHDWLTWRLRGFGPDSPNGPRLEELVTDRSDAAASGWWDARTGRHRHAELADALGHAAIKPRVMRPDGWGGEAVKHPDLGIRTGRVIGVGAHRLAAMMLGAQAASGEGVLLRGGQSSTLCALCDDVSATAIPAWADEPAESAGTGFDGVSWLPDATGRFLLAASLPGAVATRGGASTAATPDDPSAISAAETALSVAGTVINRVRAVDTGRVAARGMAAQAAWALTRALPKWATTSRVERSGPAS